MSSIAFAAPVGTPRFLDASPSVADRASLTSWIAVLAGMIGAFMAILNI
ncbi:MAG: hypothetical protein JO312_12460, partial [Hyphomicrobiales bacterium]|nr:hypothetical protein [Hyphomicrobiales bacterium]